MRCAVWSSCLTLLVPPDSAGGGLGRARVVSPRLVLFSFFASIYLFRIASVYSYVWVHTNLGLRINK